ncbi:MAG: carbohydrate porin [Proteobacteria bacterium]|nr:carbohydrate porin [Pseudomonadota bacterium]
MRVSFVASAIAVALASSSYGVKATTIHHHHRTQATASVSAVVPSSSLQAELARRDQEIAALKSALADIQAKVGDIEQRTDAQTDVNVQTARTVEDLQASAKKTDALEKIVNDTSIGGRVFVDISDIQQKKNGAATAASGYGLDVKRGYLTVNHRFNDIWSASLTTDFNYTAATGQTQLFIKNFYLQGRFSDAFTFRAGAVPMPWIPYVEGLYGYRYVENTLVDRMKAGNSADWGVGANGVFGGGRFDYAAALVNGGGYKNPARSKGMDFEGRLGFSPIDHLTLAVGGYSGDRGLETQTASAIHTASRTDAVIAWAEGNTRLGAEYFTASNWNTVLTPLRDRASGYSLWGSYGFAPAWSVFARYDRVDPSKDLNPSLRDRYYNLGAQWDVRRGVKLALVFKNDDLSSATSTQKTREVGLFGDIAF